MAEHRRQVERGAAVLQRRQDEGGVAGRGGAGRGVASGEEGGEEGEGEEESKCKCFNIGKQFLNSKKKKKSFLSASHLVLESVQLAAVLLQQLQDGVGLARGRRVQQAGVVGKLLLLLLQLLLLLLEIHLE